MKIEDKTDEEIVIIVRDGNTELYSLLIKRYKGKLSNYLKRFLNDYDEMDDVLQDVFIKVYKNLHGFKIEKKFSSWIYRIAHNEALNYIKKFKKEKTSIEDVEFKLVDKGADIREDIDNKILKKRMVKYLDKLKIKYREPVILYYFEEKSYKEISDILRLPVSTVGTLIARGRRMMLLIIKQLDDEK